MVFNLDTNRGLKFLLESHLLVYVVYSSKVSKKTNNFSFVGVALFEGTKKPPVHEAAGGF